MYNLLRRWTRSGTIDRAAPHLGDRSNGRPDEFHAVNHRPIAPPPDFDEQALFVEREVARLAARGALDEGHPDVLDRWIERQREAWELPMRQHAASRKQTAAALRKAAEHDADVTRGHLVPARREFAEADEARAWWRDVLLGVAAGRPPASIRSTSESVASPLWDAATLPSREVDLSDLEHGDE